MRVAFCVLAVLACASAVMAGGGGGDDPTGKIPGVVDLTPENFDSIINGKKHALVEFYAPWCGHCKRLVPEYTKLGELVAADPKLKSRVVIAKVDADAHRSLGEKFGVQGFPTIKYLAAGKAPTQENAVDYNSARTATAFIEYLKEKMAADKGFARVEALDPLASKFTDAKDKAAVIAEAKAAVAKLEGDAKASGELYVKFMEKAVEKGTEYLSKEKARLEKMLGTGSVAESKVEEMSKKTSVLSAFVDEE